MSLACQSLYCLSLISWLRAPETRLISSTADILPFQFDTKANLSLSETLYFFAAVIDVKFTTAMRSVLRHKHLRTAIKNYYRDKHDIRVLREKCVVGQKRNLKFYRKENRKEHFEIEKIYRGRRRVLDLLFNHHLSLSLS